MVSWIKFHPILFKACSTTLWLLLGLFGIGQLFFSCLTGLPFTHFLSFTRWMYRAHLMPCLGTRFSRQLFGLQPIFFSGSVSVLLATVCCPPLSWLLLDVPNFSEPCVSQRMREKMFVLTIKLIPWRSLWDTGLTALCLLSCSCSQHCFVTKPRDAGSGRDYS